MSEFRANLLQEIKDKFTNITWDLGSVVRELVVEPVSFIADRLESYLEQAEASLDISSLESDPENNKEAIDNWFTRLGLTQAEPKQAVGSVKLMCSSNTELTVPAGTVLSWGDVTLSVDKEYKFTPDSGFIKRGEYSYEAEVGVVTVSDTGMTLLSGTSVNWSGAPSQIYDIYVGSSISGGFSEYTSQEKINRIKAALTTASFSNEDGIRSAFLREFPATVCDVQIGRKVSTALENVNLYIKPVNSAETLTFTKEILTRVENGVTKYFVELNTNGVLSIDSCVNEYNIDITKQIDSIEYVNSIGDSDSSAIVTFKSNPNTAVTLYCTGFSVFNTVSTWLDGESKGIPFKFRLRMPVIAELGLTYEGGLSNSVLEELCSYVNNKPLNATLAASELEGIITKGGYNAKNIIYHIKETNGSQTNVFSKTNDLSLIGQLASDGKPVAMFLYGNKVKAL